MTTPVCWLDFETSSPVDLKKHGVYRYVSYPDTRVLVLCYAFDDGPIQTWTPGQKLPYKLSAHITAGHTLIAHNAQFDRLVWNHVFSAQYREMPATELHQWQCSAVRARAHGLPGSLAAIARAMALPITKQPQGAKLIRLYSRTGAYWSEIPEQDQCLFVEYCRGDVELMRNICRPLRELTPAEWAEYHLNELINIRGLPVDVAFSEAAAEYSEDLRKDAGEEIRGITGNVVRSATVIKSRNQWLTEHLTPGQLALISPEGKIIFDKEHRALLAEAPALQPQVVEFLAAVERAGGATSKKYLAINDTQIAGRVQGTLLFNGAGQTGRFSAQRLQPHNMRRDVMKHPDQIIADVVEGLEIDNPADTLARLIRASIYHPGRLAWADYSNIEGRVAPWLCDSEEGDDALDRFEAGIDPYVYNASRLFHVEQSAVTPDQRQAGKCQQLALGFLGGKGALMAMAKNFGLSYSVFEAQAMVVAWREANPWAVKIGAQLETAVRQAVNYPGKEVTVGMVTYCCQGDWLWCRLPSGRLIAYFQPRVERGQYDYQVTALWGGGLPKAGEQWPRRSLYYSILLENITQAVAADILREALTRIDLAGLRIVGHVHDEVIIEGNQHEQLRDLMLVAPDWADGLPMKATSATGIRYGEH